MSLIAWNETMSMGIEIIDRQHRGLVELANALHEAILNKAPDGQRQAIFEELIRHTREHFAFEEALFAEHGYPELEEHQQEHVRLIEQIEEFKRQAAAGDLVSGVESMQFIKKWVSAHILESDKQYSGYMISRGVD
jgi:hemerythrin-like metal-binding protein